MDEIKAILASFWSWGALATGAILGVWWSKMTPTTANLTLAIGIAAAAVAVFLFPLNTTQPTLIRALWAIVVCGVLSLVVYYTLWSKAPRPQASNDAASTSAVAELSKLGWTVKPDSSEIEFEIWAKPLPPMKESAVYFTQLQTPFRLHFQGVKNLDGLHELATIKGCNKIEINAGEFSDISELQGFGNLTILTISQTPINGLSVVDSSPLSSLTSLRKLNLNYTKIRTIDSLKELTHLEEVNLGSTLIRDLAPLAKHDTLKSLEIRDTEVSDLTALSGVQSLSELTVSEKQVPGLVKLANLPNLKKLTIIDQGPTLDLSPINRLSNLEYLWLWIVRFDLKPLHSLVNLRELMLTGGVGLDGLSDVTDIQVLGDLKELRKLTLGSLNANDMSFMANLGNLEELNISRMPISSITPLRSLSSLKSVSLAITDVTDISPLLELPALTSLNVMRTPARADILTKLERRGVSVRR